jgi:hypothetical protein
MAWMVKQSGLICRILRSICGLWATRAFGLETLPKLTFTRHRSYDRRHPALDAGSRFFEARRKAPPPFEAACGVAQDRPSQVRGDVR